MQDFYCNGVFSHWDIMQVTSLNTSWLCNIHTHTRTPLTAVSCLIAVCVCVQAAAASGQRHVGCWGNCCPRQRLQPQRLLLLHGEYNTRQLTEECCMMVTTHPMSLSYPPPSAYRHAPGLCQHEDVHAGGFGRGHHQRCLRPRALPHTRLPGGQQTWRPAHSQHHTVNQDRRRCSDVHREENISGSIISYFYYEMIIDKSSSTYQCKIKMQWMENHTRFSHWWRNVTKYIYLGTSHLSTLFCTCSFFPILC